MQFEEFNKKIQEAAEQHHPAYDEKAWQKMEKLLDKHMPVKEKDKRRFIFFILFFLVVGGGVFIAIDQPWRDAATAKNDSAAFSARSRNENQVNSQIDQLNTPGTTVGDHKEAGTVESNDQPSSKNNTNPGGNVASNSFNSSDQESRQPYFEKSNLSNRNERFVLKPENPKSNEVALNTPPKKDDANQPKSGNQQSAVDQINRRSDLHSAEDPTTSHKDDERISKKDEVPAVTGQTKTDKENQTLEKNSSAASPKKNKGKKNFLDGFAFTLSGGPDVSKAGSSKFGKTTFAYGGGLSYSFKKFTLRSGVYTANLIYSAGQNDYKLNYTLPSNIKFEGADAECKVLEIPLSLTYNFMTRKNSAWFAGAGLSSYLMTREEYTYWYSNTTVGNFYSRYYEIKNKNKHFFSVIDLSAGYTRQLTRNISVSAEPYVKIPFKGIGQGKVYLNSGGILFTVGIRPFNHNK